MIVAGIAPAFLGNLADTIGRRAVYLLMMGIYCVANVGLTLQSNWTALFILRMVQSAGSAGRQSALLLFNTTERSIMNYSYHRCWIRRRIRYCYSS
jgi:MFS family permease